jgi:hypothetical protein
MSREKSTRQYSQTLEIWHHLSAFRGCQVRTSDNVRLKLEGTIFWQALGDHRRSHGPIWFSRRCS